MINLNKISKSFVVGEIETMALNQINLEIKAGEFVAVMGPSGCGKSTLLNVLGLIDNPTEGEYVFGEIDVSNFSESKLTDIRKENIGFIFQNFNLIDELTISENIELPLQYLGVDKNERLEKVKQVLARVDLSHRANHMPDQLSGGQQQRVAIARAVVSQPKVLLADEPTGNLDTKNSTEVMSMLQEFAAEGMTIVMVTHSEEEGRKAHRLVRMLDGRVQIVKSSERGCHGEEVEHA